MRRIARVALAGVLAAALAVGVVAPAGAVVDEIVGEACNGKGGQLSPPGISQGGPGTDGNTAAPVRGKLVLIEAGYAGHSDLGAFPLFKFDHPSVKVIPITGDPDPFFFGNIYVEAFELDPNFPAHDNCKSDPTA